MIARAKRALPGMVVSMILAGPAFAGTQATDNATTHPRKPSHPALLHKKSPLAAEPERTEDHERMAFVEDTSVWSDSPSAGHGGGGGGGWKQTGFASWYGGARWHNHMTASGARYNENELTAAHAWLPIGTRVLVALNNGSGRSVVVTINDRPGTHTRVIDLSRAAARELGMMSSGVAMVTLSPL